MAIEIRVPALGESVTEATVRQWFKQPGDAVNADEPLLELETDKVTLEVPAPAAGVLADIKVPQGSTVAVGSVLGSIRDRDGAALAAPQSAAAKPQGSQPAAPKPADVAQGAMPPSPSARKLMEENGLLADAVPGTAGVA